MNSPDRDDDLRDDGHVGEWIADYVFDRLDEVTRRRVDEHLHECGDCAEDYRFAARLRAGGHLAAERIVEIADGRGTTSESEREHLVHCDDCRDELEVLQAMPAPPELRVQRAPLRRARAPHRWGTAGAFAALAVAAAVVLMLMPRGGDLARFAQVEPLPVRVVRSTPEPGSFEALRLAGLTAYRDGEYARAEDRLGEALGKHPSDAELWLYRGSAQLVLGENATAAESLRRALELDAGQVGEEARWQRAQALLRLGDDDTALAELRTLAAGRGDRAADAQTLLQQLEAE